VNPDSSQPPKPTEPQPASPAEVRNPTSAAPPASRLRLLCLVGLLGVLAGAYVSHFPLPDFDPPARATPTYLERWVLRLSGPSGPREPDILYVPTPQALVERMLELAELKPDDVLYDLGCGDGRFVVTAARRYGIRAVGVDIDPARVADARRNAKRQGVERLVTIKQGDIFELDFSDATVVTLYLLPELNVRLMPKLARLRPGTRILSFEFDMAGAKPARVVEVAGEGQRRHKIYQWIVPWEPE
jgi:SAM-dependent methyltransferase